MRLLLPSLLLFGLAGSAAARSQQQVTFRGMFDDDGTGFYTIACSNVTVTSSTVSLQAFTGQFNLITGNWNGDPANPVVDVTAIQKTAKSFELTGNNHLGGTVQFVTLANPGETASVFWSADKLFTPIQQRGALMMDPRFINYLGTGTIPADGSLELPLAVPSSTSLVGVRILGQAGVWTAPNSYYITNSGCKSVLP